MARRGKGGGGPARLAAIPVLLWISISALRSGAFRRTDPQPRHASYAMVLDGQGLSGSRGTEGLRLLREGRIDTLVLSGTEIGGGFVYSMVWVRMLPLAGPERRRTLELRSGSTSTQDEARLADSVFSNLGQDTVVVVTSTYHAWRAGSIFRRETRSGVVFRIHSAPDPGWDGGWTDREGLKLRFFEWSKRVVWVLWEQWFPVRSGPPWHMFVRGPDLGEVPPPAWTP